jgi:hypothetical protein
MLNYSVIIPVHNGEPYIGLAIESVLAQTYTNFELLILENASQDKTMEIVKSYSDPRIKVIPSSKLLNIYENWQRILNLELAEFLTILGHDDLLQPKFLEEITKLISHEPGASLFHTHFDIIDSDGNLIRHCKPVPYRESSHEFLRQAQLARHDSFGTGYVARSIDYKKIGGMPDFPSLYYADDIMWSRLAAISEKICSPERLFSYRFHQKSAGYGIGLLAMYHASKMYLETLREMGYMQLPVNASAAHQCVSKTFSRQQYKVLTKLIAEPEAEKLATYRQEKAEIRREAKLDRLFPVDDIVSRISEYILHLSMTPLRQTALALMEGAKVATRFIRHR